MICLKILLSLFILINTNKVDEIHLLLSAKLNGTSPFIDLSLVKLDQSYLYFLFDFDFHSNNVPESKDTAFFRISTHINIPVGEELTKDSISYRFSNKEWTQLQNSRIVNNIMYKKVRVLQKEKVGDEYVYYFKIDKKDNKNKTLILRVPILGVKNGYFTIENILQLPKFTKN